MNRITIVLILTLSLLSCNTKKQTPGQVVENYLSFLNEGNCEEAKGLCMNSAKENFVCREFKSKIKSMSCDVEGDLAKCTSIELRANGTEHNFGYGLVRYENTWLIDHFFKVLQPLKLDLKTPFENYVHEIRVIDIPYNSDNNFESLDIESVFKPEGSLLQGKLKSINNYHFIIYWYAADISLPILEVYNNNGKKVNEVQLLDIHFCSYEYPNQDGRFKIEKDGEIILENYTLINDIERVVSSDTISLKKIIK